MGSPSAQTGGSDGNGKGKGRIGRDGFPIEDDPNKVINHYRSTLRDN